ncbi:TerB family tellurite resistance protein [Paucidesulfovibrio longus]|uniref:TerB family tellurite resistance protein n=1 Tax=Paucidesulfovibrio longus TaxID=889 RepID=UPI0003B65C71|nr:TerB family tellurite resistance protein [Paucidesulfovibrio longus]
MGVLDVIPGVSAAKNIAAGVGGAALGGVMGFFVGRRGQKEARKELEVARKEFEQEKNRLLARLEKIDQEREEMALLRVALLRQLAWEDGVLSDSEKLFIIDYIVHSEEIMDSKKIEAIKELDLKPARISSFLKHVAERFGSPPHICGSRIEAEGFVSVLTKVAHVDGEYTRDEERYVEYVKRLVGVS